MPHSEHIQGWTKLLLPACSPYPSVISPFTVKPRSLILYPSANHASPTHHSSTLHSDQLVQAAITSDPGYHNSLWVCLLHLFAALNIFSTEQPGEGATTSTQYAHCFDWDIAVWNAFISASRKYSSTVEEKKNYTCIVNRGPDVCLTLKLQSRYPSPIRSFNYSH